MVQSAEAQAPELGGLLPAGGPRGQTTSIRIEGKSLAGAAIHLSGSGIVVRSQQVNPGGDQLTAEVAVDASAALGPHEVRIATAKGVSNGARFWVDVRPNRVIEKAMAETDPPFELDSASPAVINSRIAAKASRDRFVINAATGETWSFDCYADRIRSRFDPVMELTDAAGVSLKLVQSTWESDPRFSYRFVKAGRYLLTVRDSEYNGGPNYTYRLLAGRMPLLEGYLPRGERPGHDIQLALEGTSLPAPRADITIPATAATGEYWAAVPMGDCGPALVPLLVDSEPVVDAAEIRTLPALPTAIDGVFEHSSSARFSFAAAAKQAIRFDLLGHRIGSRIDGEIRVLDSAGKELAENDDFEPLSKDSRVDFTAPAAGAYTVVIRNVEEVIGPDCFYRLKVTPIQPDFNVAIAVDRLAVPAGGTILLPIRAERIGGFDGPIELRVDGLPPGMSCSGGVIPAGKMETSITLTSDLGAAIGASDVHVLGTAQVGGKPVTREAPAWEKYEHRSIDLLLSVEYTYPRPHHLWDMLLAAVTERTDPITVTSGSGPIALAPGSKIEIPVKIVRQPKAEGEIKLELRGLPAKVTASVPAIPANQTDGKIILTAAADATPDVANVIIEAKLGNATALAPAIRVIVGKR